MSNLAVTQQDYQSIWATNALANSDVRKGVYCGTVTAKQAAGSVDHFALFDAQIHASNATEFRVEVSNASVDKAKKEALPGRSGGQRNRFWPARVQIRTPKLLPATVTISEPDLAALKLLNQFKGRRINMRSVAVASELRLWQSLFIREEASALVDAPWATRQKLVSERLDLISKLKLARVGAELDDDSSAAADAAIADANTLVKDLEFIGSPVVSQSEDGILTIHWSKKDLGVALLFDGDGTVSVSYSRPGQRYTVGIEAFAICDPLPAKFYEFVRAL